MLRGSLMNGEVPIRPSFPPILGSDAGFRALPCPASTALMGCARALVVPTTPPLPVPPRWWTSSWEVI